MKKIIVLLLIFSLFSLYGNVHAKERHGADLKIQKKAGQQIRGELIAVKENSLLLMERDSGADATVDIEDIKVVKIVKKSKTFIGAGLGLLISGGAGYLFGYISECPECHKTGCTSNGAMYGVLGAGFGVLIGGITGAFAGKDKTIRIEGKSDSEIKEILENLRKKARVPNFQ